MPGFARFSACLLALLCLLLSAVAQQPPAEPRLMPGDVVRITVPTHDGYGGEFQVFEDGTINDRALGRMYVRGMSLEELRLAALKKLKESLRDPIVTVTLRHQRLPKVYIIGPERGSGAIDLLPDTDIRKLVAMVSLPADPDLLDVILYRATGETVRIDLWGVLQGKEDAWNGKLLPEDIVAFIPKPFIKVWFIGPFSKTGELKVREGLDIYEALSQIGGVNPAPLQTLDEAQLLIRRGPETVRVPAKHNAQGRGLVLQAGDVVMLDEPKAIRVYVGGEVTTPGEFIVREDLPLSKLLLQAHGTTDVGTLRNVILFRGSDVIRLDATGPLEGGAPSDFKLQDGDFFWVELNQRYLYAFGQVNAPGKVLFRDGIKMTLADLLARVNGLTGDGSLRRILVLRPNAEGKYVASKYNLDEFIKDGKLEANPEVLPGDVVLFGEPKGFSLRTLGQIISGALLFDTLYQSRGGGK